MTASLETIEMARFGAGEGLPVLLLHEGLGSLAMWRDFPEILAAASGRPVIAWSRRGYGASGQFERPYAPDFMHREADDAACLMERLGIARAHILGHSDGASIALLVAARHPARVASLVLEAPHVRVELVTLDAIRALGETSTDGGLIARLGNYHRDAAAMFAQWFTIWTDPAFAGWTIEDELDGISCPALLIQGEDDEFGTFDQLDRIAARLPQARQVRLAECGHCPHRDQASAVLAAATAFWEDPADA